MTTMELPDLGREAASLVRRACETGEIVEIREHGIVIAHVIPSSTANQARSDLRGLLQDLDMLAPEINEAWPQGVSAEEAISDVRRTP